MKLVLDADVLIGALDRNDAQHTRARRLFTGWRESRDTPLISVVNLAEVLIAPAADARTRASAREAIGALGITVSVPSEATGIEATRLRQRYPVSLPDAFCLATAKPTGSILASFDREFIRAARQERIALV